MTNPRKDRHEQIEHVARMVRSGEVPSMGRWSPWEHDAIADAILDLLTVPVSAGEREP